MNFRQLYALAITMLACVTLGAQEKQTGVDEEILSECNTILTAEQEAYMQAIRQNGRRLGSENSPKGEIRIPVQHHIYRRSDGTGGLALSSIETITSLLNTAYADARLVFYSCADPIEYHDDNFFSLRTESEEAMCESTEVENVLNIYYVDEVLYAGINMCGYTYFPGGKDRLIIDEECATNGSTIIHEIGHYFSLRHTHGNQAPGMGTDELVDGSNCGTAGDNICDTPADPGLNYLSVSSGCNYTGNERDLSGQSYTPLTDNHMSYSRRDCRINFTAQQTKAISFSAMNDRKYLGCPCDKPENPASFTTATSATLSWDEVQGAEGYELKGRIGTAGPFRGLAVRNNLKLVKKLRPVTTYQWKVRTHCENGGISKYTAIHEFTTPAERIAKPHEAPLRPVVVYPNPVVNDLGVETVCPTSGKIDIEVFDLYGHKKMTWQSRCTPGAYTLDLPVDELPVGGYVISVQQGERIQRARFEISR